MDTARFSSPVGMITITADGDSITGLSIGHDQESRESTNPCLREAQLQLKQYFLGQRTSFDLACAIRGTPFQEKIWSALEEIGYGETLTYGELAERIGKPGSARAVGGAVGANPVPIIIPCHRVMGTSGAITGYSAGDGIPTKKALLDLEGITYRV